MKAFRQVVIGTVLFCVLFVEAWGRVAIRGIVNTLRRN